MLTPLTFVDEWLAALEVDFFVMLPLVYSRTASL